MMMDAVADAFLIERIRRFRDGTKRFPNLPELVRPPSAPAAEFDPSDPRLAAYRDGRRAALLRSFRDGAVSIPSDRGAYLKDVPPDPWSAAIGISRERARVQAMSEGREQPSIWDVLPYLLTGGKPLEIGGGKSLALAGGKPFMAMANPWGMRGSPTTRAHIEDVAAWFLRQHPGAKRRGFIDPVTGQVSETYDAPPGVSWGNTSAKGSRYSDLWFELPSGETVVQTVTIHKRGKRGGKPTQYELDAADAFRRMGHQVLLVPKLH